MRIIRQATWYCLQNNLLDCHATNIKMKLEELIRRPRLNSLQTKRTATNLNACYTVYVLPNTTNTCVTVNVDTPIFHILLLVQVNTSKLSILLSILY